MQNGNQVFRGGIPYGPDIRRLEEAFPLESLTEGRVIGHQDIEGALDLPRTAARYYGVVNAWIRQCRNLHSVIVIWNPKIGLSVLDPENTLRHGVKRIQQKSNQTRRAVSFLAWVDRKRLDANGQRALDHQIRVANALAEAAKIAKTELAVELPLAKSLPRRIA